ncbi:efflux transporter outer membrane subunit [Kerstersia gyiorum]|uniref:efflux transporter outer membrane subunit n=1 Tax=Kerstersia gyiorum TaxID=206506 RepID=UPI00107126F2|nr:efflux transporter outer membrane subunit [Kerstersia gyiorum]QBR39330.1 efflux transporter outer membrane subunit [Kerstersia gyiorum]
MPQRSCAHGFHALPHAALPAARRSKAWAPMLTALLVLAGCASGPGYQRPAALEDMPASFRQMDGWRTATPGQALTDTAWWQRYQDPVLTELLTRIDGHNQNLLQAEARLRQAEALIGRARAAGMPTAGANAGYTRSTGGTNNYSTGLNISWLPDIWGRVQRDTEAAQAAAQASAADVAAVRLGLQSNLAQAYFRLITLDRQAELLAATEQAYIRAAELTRNQYEAGISARADVVLAETQLEQVRAQRYNIAWQRAQNEHAIAVLAGAAPSALQLAEQQTLPALPPLPQALPASLLERRPDIAMAERNMAAANARIGVAASAWFPDLTLNTSGGFQHNSLNHWLTAPSRVWSLGPALALTIFDGGARQATLEHAEAAYDEQVARYRQTVLEALRETEDALAALRTRAQEIERQEKVVALAEENLRLVMNRYQAGIVTYLEVTTAQTTELNARNTLFALQGEQLAASVQLIAALGGGWSDAALADTPAATKDSAPADQQGADAPAASTATLPSRTDTGA